MFGTIVSGRIFYAILMIVLAIAITKITFWIIKKVVLKISEKTKTNLDDYLVRAMELPVEIGMFLFGLYITLDYFITIPTNYTVLTTQIFQSFGVCIFLWMFSRILNAFVKWYGEKWALDRVQKTVYFSIKNIFFVFFYIIGIVAILYIFGIELTPIVASLGIGGIAVALALQSTLTNYFAGIYITADSSVKIGDYIETNEGIKGNVERVGWRTTRIRTLQDNLIIVPNSKISESIVTNYHDPTEEVNVSVKCGVAYFSDLDRVEKMTLDVAKKVTQSSEYSVKSFEPKFRYEKFGDSNIDFFVVLRAKDYSSQFLVVHEFIKELDKAFKKHGIEISGPVRKILMEKK